MSDLPNKPDTALDLTELAIDALKHGDNETADRLLHDAEALDAPDQGKGAA